MPPTALPTLYGGITFRSRLEADWAATLDDRHVPWQYEPEGLQLSDGTRYAPDFWLTSAAAWLEIKGSHMERYSKVELLAHDLWNESAAPTPASPNSPMVVIGYEPTRTARLHDPGSFEAITMHAIGRIYQPYDIHFAQCPTCRSNTLAVFGQDHCRACGASGSVIYDEFLGCWIDDHYLDRPFVRVPRQFGQRSA